jgi:hypothetical protein
MRTSLGLRAPFSQVIFGPEKRGRSLARHRFQEKGTILTDDKNGSSPQEAFPLKIGAIAIARDVDYSKNAGANTAIANGMKNMPREYKNQKEQSPCKSISTMPSLT